MTDPQLCTAAQALSPGLTAFERQIVALARLRLMRGETLRPHQRHTLVQLVTQHTPPTQKEPTP